MQVEYISQGLYSHSDPMSDQFKVEETKRSPEGYTEGEEGLMSVGVCPFCWYTITCNFGVENDTRDAQIREHLVDCPKAKEALQERKEEDAAAAAPAVHGFKGVARPKS